jgi:hypothetical protein
MHRLSSKRHLTDFPAHPIRRHTPCHFIFIQQFSYVVFLNWSSTISMLIGRSHTEIKLYV